MASLDASPDLTTSAIIERDKQFISNETDGPLMRLRRLILSKITVMCRQVDNG